MLARRGSPSASNLAATLLHLLRETVALAHPIIPFVTEELWSHLGDPGELLAGSAYPRAVPALLDERAEAEVERAIGAVTLIRGWRDSVDARSRACSCRRVCARRATDRRAQPWRAWRAWRSSNGTSAPPLASAAAPPQATAHAPSVAPPTGIQNGQAVAPRCRSPAGRLEMLSAEGLDLEAAARGRDAARESSRARSRACRASSRMRASRRKRPRPSSRASARSWRACARSWRRCEGSGVESISGRPVDRRGADADRSEVPAGERGGGATWSGERAERHLRSLELFGMRFGLDRMRRMMTVLGSPERRFRSIHVVGTNGKSSTTRMIAAILERHGLRSGAYLSPHLISYTERVQVGERDLSMHAFAAAVARAAWAAERVNRTLAADDHVTQFELLTAAAFWALAEEGVEVAVIEAGLGGRYDATAVIESSVTVLTNVGLEHTRWLGPTVRDIAAEKLAVLRPETTLALGADLDPEALAVAAAVAGERDARIVRAAAGEHAVGSARGAFPAAQLRARARGGRGVSGCGGDSRARGGGARRSRVVVVPRGACRCSARTR